MYPMTLQESGDSTGSVSLAGLFSGTFAPEQRATDARELVDIACRGGWPEALGLSADDAQLIAREYMRVLRAESVPRQGKDAGVAQRLLFSLARNLGQSVTYKTIKADTANEALSLPMLTVDEKTIRSYLELLKALFIVEEIPGWMPPARSPKRVTSKPKRYFADPSLAVATLAMSPESLMADWQTFGLVFENLVIRDLLVYAQAMESAGDVPVRYYRDDSGLEVDAIIELADGRWAAFEIKTSEAKVEEGIANLKRLRDKLTRNARARTRKPEFMAVITGVSQYARRVEDGIYVIPIRCLGA